jgi:hypothetical protein
MEVACSKHGSAAACALVSGKGLAHGSYTSRNYDGYACDGGEDAGCGQLTAAYESGQAAVSQDACRGIRNGEGGNPLACIEAHTMHTFGVGAEKNEVLGGGGGLGLYREGPGKVNEALFSGGVKEFVQFNVFLETVVVGVRIEQQQLFQEHPAMPLDHVTAVYAVFGGRSDD